MTAPFNLDELVLPPLQELRILHDVGSLAYPMLLSAATSLQQLHLAPTRNSKLIAQLSELHFPRLSALHMERLWDEEALLPFIARHAPQLTELSLIGDQSLNTSAAFSDLFGLQYPRLGIFRIHDTRSVSILKLSELVHNAPNLRAVIAVRVPLVLFALPVLATLTEYHEFDGEATFSLLESPRLRALRLSKRALSTLLVLPSPLLLLVAASSLTLTSASEHAQLWEALAQIPHVKQLGVELRVAPDAPPPGLSLPRLRDLSLQFSTSTSVAALAASLMHLLSLNSPLDTLTLTLDQCELTGAAMPLVKVIAVLMARGVDVTITGIPFAMRNLMFRHCGNPWGELNVGRCI